jgi:hypothetical protein
MKGYRLAEGREAHLQGREVKGKVIGVLGVDGNEHIGVDLTDESHELGATGVAGGVEATLPLEDLPFALFYLYWQPDVSHPEVIQPVMEALDVHFLLLVVGLAARV